MGTVKCEHRRTSKGACIVLPRIDHAFANDMLSADKEEAVRLYRGKLRELRELYPEAAAFLGLPPKPRGCALLND